MDSTIIELAPEYPEYVLVFYGGISGWEQSRGYRSHVYLKQGDTRNWLLYFYDPIRLAQDLENEDFVAENGLVVLNDVTVDNMVNAVKTLIQLDYFSNQKIFSAIEIEQFLR